MMGGLGIILFGKRRIGALLPKYNVTQRLFHREYGAITIYRIESSWDFPENAGGFDGNFWIKGRFPPTTYWFGTDEFVPAIDSLINFHVEIQAHFEKQIIGIVNVN